MRSLADAVDADKAELLDLAGYSDDAELERARVRRLRARGGWVSGPNLDLEALRLLAPDFHAAIEHLLGVAAALVTPEP